MRILSKLAQNATRILIYSINYIMEEKNSWKQN